jgi:hypothetical protein
LPEKTAGFIKRSSAVLRGKPYRSTYFTIRLALRFLRSLHISIFEQPVKWRTFEYLVYDQEGRVVEDAVWAAFG